MAKKGNAWKTLSIIFIILFVLVVVGGLLKASRFKSAISTATDDQIQQAKDVAMSDLAKRGIDTSGLQFKVADKTRNLEQGKQIIEVSAYNLTLRHQYVLDADTGDILMYSMTEFHDGLNHSIDNERGINHMGLFPGFP